MAVKALYLHHALMSNSLKGPSKSVSPLVIHSLIEKSVTVIKLLSLFIKVADYSNYLCFFFNNLVFKR